MKLFVVFIACIYFTQVCLSAPAGDVTSSESSEYFTDADIAEMRSDLKDIPGINPKSIDDFAVVLGKFRKNSTDSEMLEGVLDLLSLAVKGPTCGDEPKIDLKQIFDSSSSEESKGTKNDKGDKTDSSSEELTEEDLKAMEQEMAKVMTTEQKNRAMGILRAFRKGASERERDAAALDLFMSSIAALSKTCATSITDNHL